MAIPSIYKGCFLCLVDAEEILVGAHCRELSLAWPVWIFRFVYANLQ